MTPSIDNDLNLKNKIQQKEVEIQTELLRSRKERAKLIKSARLEAEEIISEYQKNLEKQYLEWEENLDETFSEFLTEIRTKKAARLKTIDEAWETKASQFTGQIIKSVLPEPVQSKWSEFID